MGKNICCTRKPKFNEKPCLKGISWRRIEQTPFDLSMHSTYVHKSSKNSTLTHTHIHPPTNTTQLETQTKLRFLSRETKIYSSLIRPEGRHSQMMHSFFKSVSRDMICADFGNINTCICSHHELIMNKQSSIHMNAVCLKNGAKLN